MIPLSILDLAFINRGSTAKDALESCLKVTRRAEELGYKRIWVAEHHNAPSIASAATSVVIGYLASHTQKIRVGAGGIMLPNHSPLIIAEQFGTLESLYPGRIDLGLGRAPGTDQKTLHALRRDINAAETFPQDVVELQSYFEDAEDGQIQAVPGTGLKVPLWILGSSTFGAQLAAMLGLPYAFASHFAPDALMDAIQIYKRNFKPSKQLEKPYLMVAANVIAAQTDQEAKYYFTSMQQSFANLVRGKRDSFPPPIEDIESYWNEREKMVANRMLACSAVGSPDTVKKFLKDFLEKTGADELITVSSIYDINARLKSFEILAEVAKTL